VLPTIRAEHRHGRVTGMAGDVGVASGLRGGDRLRWHHRQPRSRRLDLPGLPRDTVATPNFL